ncbi:hypothetical protein [Marivirga sericea]|uniref:hypothetical protein n=1 Tax=Marivirga sericea TaxID=1028 RepID=UPI00111C1E3E|nr:hypothetical protein [Marivirga sericea]
MIFLSVFFAFWLSEYRESKKDSETLDISIQYIASEMTYNHHRIESIFKYHSDLLREIDSLRQQSDSNWMELEGSDLTNWKGLQTPLLRSAAYQTYLNSNLIDNVEFEWAKSLTRVYYAQSITERLDNSFIEYVITDSESLTSLPRLRNLIRIYLSTLPEVMMEYQRAKKEWLNKYGYDIDIENDELRNEVNRRMRNY